MNDPSRRAHLPVIFWLYFTAGMVFAMIVIGAITRLTESGLSMVEWRPLIGALPPVSEQEWQRVFALYKQTPEFRLKNFWMGIEDFKTIFFWEWFHRLWGQLIGLVYGLPLLWFWLRGQIPAGYGLKLLLLLGLGGMQGVMGWYMVESGLVDIPAVSHYRLAAHLGLAFLIFACVIWLGLSISSINRASPYESRTLFIHTVFVLAAFILTFIWGAFTAGMDAGLVYNETFPMMGGQWLPASAQLLSPFWLNFIETHGGVQFAHRWLAMGTVLVAGSLWLRAVRAGNCPAPVHGLAAMVLLQAGLGIATLLSAVWMPLAVLHQAGAVLLLLFLTVSLFAYRPSRLRISL